MILSADLPLFDRWALCAQRVGEEEVWVGSMAGEIVALDLDLNERRRWQAHEGSVNGILSDGTTYSGDGLVKDAGGNVLAGPFKKPVTKVQRVGGKLYVGTYERALYIDGKKHPKIAAWHVLADGRLAIVRQIGSKAGDLGPIELQGEEIGPPAWALKGGRDGSALRAFLKEGRFVELSKGPQPSQRENPNTNVTPSLSRGSTGDMQGLRQAQPDAGVGVLESKSSSSMPVFETTTLPWNNPQGPPSIVQDGDREYFIGNHQVLEIADGTLARKLKLETKGLYGSTSLPNNRLIIAAADGNLKAINLAA